MQGYFTNLSVALVVTSILALAVWYVSFWISRRRLYQLAGKIPKVPRSLPLIGIAHHSMGNTETYAQYIKWIGEVSVSEGGVVGAWIGPAFQVYVTNAEDIEEIANASQEKNISPFSKPWLGDGITPAPVDIWKPRRKALMPTFSQKVLDGYMGTFNEQGQILVEKLRKEQANGLFDIFQYISRCTLDITCETLMGVTINAQDHISHPYVEAAGDQLSIVMERIIKIWLQPDFLFQMSPLARRQKKNVAYLHQFSQQVIHRKLSDLKKIKSKLSDTIMENDINDSEEPKPRTRKALLDTLLELSDVDVNWTEKELGEEVDNFILGGNDTSANTVSFALMLLGARPQFQEKLMKELHEVFGESSRYVTKEDLAALKYTECVLKETMRLFPVAPVLFRYLEKELKISNCTLPATTMCHLNLYGVQRRKDIWGSNANEFNPDRFLPENISKTQKQSFLAFGAGPRNCIGVSYAMMATKVLLTTILRNYVVAANKGAESTPLKCVFVFKAVNGYNVSIKPRIQVK